MTDYATFPLVRLTVEGMKHQIVMAMHEYVAKMDEDIQAAIEAEVTPENIARMIEQEVHRTLSDVVRSEVEKFYRYGDGQRVVRKVLEARLKGTDGEPF